MPKIKSTSPGVARRLVTFLVLPRKVTKRNRPRFAAPAGYPALLDWSGGCGTRASRSDSPHRHLLTSLRYSAALRGKNTKTQNRKFGCKNNSTPVHWCLEVIFCKRKHDSLPQRIT